MGLPPTPGEDSTLCLCEQDLDSRTEETVTEEEA